MSKIKEKKHFWGPFPYDFEVTPSEIYRFMPRVLHQMKAWYIYITQLSFLKTKVLSFILETFRSLCSSHFEPILGGFSWNAPPNVVQFVE